MALAKGTKNQSRGVLPDAAIAQGTAKPFQNRDSGRTWQGSKLIILFLCAELI